MYLSTLLQFISKYIPTVLYGDMEYKTILISGLDGRVMEIESVMEIKSDTSNLCIGSGEPPPNAKGC